MSLWRRPLAGACFGGALLLVLLASGALGFKSLSRTQSAAIAAPYVTSHADINLITGAEAFPNVTQSESAMASHEQTIVVAYTDSRGSTLSPSSVCGVSVSTDSGSTFSRLPYKFNEGGTCYGKSSV